MLGKRRLTADEDAYKVYIALSRCSILSEDVVRHAFDSLQDILMDKPQTQAELMHRLRAVFNPTFVTCLEWLEFDRHEPLELRVDFFFVVRRTLQRMGEVNLWPLSIN